MDALTALWFTSIVGAVGFTATGFFLARSRIIDGDADRAAEPASQTRELTPASTPPPPGAASTPPPPGAASTPPPPSTVATLPPPAEIATLPPPNVVTRALAPSMAPSMAPSTAPSTASSTAPRKDLRREEGDEGRSPDNETDVVPSESERPARPRRGASIAPPAAETLELERQLHALRIELRSEVVARNKIELHSRELAARLSAMSEQMTAARSRESVQKRASIMPSAAADARSKLSIRAPGLFAEIDELKADIVRLTAENTTLRAAALGAPAPVPRASGARTDLVAPEALKLMIDRIRRLDHVRAAAVAESGGLVLAGSGELSDALAAFGANMNDAASRSVRLLPLRSIDEVTVRDSHGLLFSTRVLGRPAAELALVMLASGEVPMREVREIREIIAQTPGLDADGITVPR